MGNENRGFIPGQIVIGTVDLMFRNGVKGRGRLIKDKNTAVFIQRPGEQKPLDLAPGKMDAIFINIFAYMGLQPLRQSVCPGKDTGFLQAILHTG